MTRRIGSYNSGAPLLIDEDWMAHGACAQPDVTRVQKAAFFADTDRGAAAAALVQGAKQMCSTCAVKDPCRRYAAAADQHGIWGGMDQQERRKWRKLQVRAG